MGISRRDFLKYCTASAALLGLSSLEVERLEAALRSPSVPTIIWLHGAGCQGDSVSFLNRIASSDPPGTKTADDILINSVNLAYHSVLMTAAGQQAVTVLSQAQRQGGYILALEGGIPRAWGGHACTLYEDNGQTVTYQQAVTALAPGAVAILAVGTCAAFGGIPRSGAGYTNGPTDIISAKEAVGLGKTVINIAGCPANPDWTAWTIVQLLSGVTPALDAYGRPTALFGANIHHNCPRNLPNNQASTFGEDHKCLITLGCRGPIASADCPSRKWNNKQNWCVDSNGLCLGCVEPSFPDTDFYIKPY